MISGKISESDKAARGEMRERVAYERRLATVSHYGPLAVAAALKTGEKPTKY
jgi:hypothetical protein